MKTEHSPYNDIIMMKKIVYLSGPITNAKDLNVQQFKHFERKFLELGYQVINPHNITDNHKELTWEEYMRNDFSAILSSDILVVLPDWSSSKGAVAEILFAQTIGLLVIHAEDESPFEYVMEVKATRKSKEE